MSKKVKRHRYELWQDGLMVVMVEAPTAKQAKSEINHYAMIYGQDGPIKVVKK